VFIRNDWKLVVTSLERIPIMNQESAVKIGDFCTEEILLKSLALNKKTLDVLRSRRKFPFINLTKKQRLYYLPDVCEWLLQNKRVLNIGAGDLS
jgi:hypothetical protein